MGISRRAFPSEWFGAQDVGVDRAMGRGSAAQRGRWGCVGAHRRRLSGLVSIGFASAAWLRRRWQRGPEVSEGRRGKKSHPEPMQPSACRHIRRGAGSAGGDFDQGRLLHGTAKRIDLLRGGGLAPFAWTDPVLTAGVTPVRFAHLLELRRALAAVYRALGRAGPVFRGQ